MKRAIMLAACLVVASPAAAQSPWPAGVPLVGGMPALPPPPASFFPHGATLPTPDYSLPTITVPNIAAQAWGNGAANIIGEMGRQRATSLGNGFQALAKGLQELGDGIARREAIRPQPAALPPAGFAVPAAPTNGHPCRADIARFCQGVAWGKGRIRECLAGHYSEIAPACGQALAKISRILPAGRMVQGR